MKLTPQIRLTGSLVMLLLCVGLIGDTMGLLPRAEDQIRESRKILGEALAVQLSSVAANGNEDVIATTLESVVVRNSEINHGVLLRADGSPLAQYGEAREESVGRLWSLSTLDDLVVPIYDVAGLWGEVRLQFEPTDDIGLRYLGFPAKSLMFLAFLCLACMSTFYLFLRKALKELNPTKAVPERVHSAFEVLAEGVIIIDEKQRIVLVNASFATRVNELPEALLGRSPNDFEWDLSGKEGQELPWQLALDQGEQVMGMQLRLTTATEKITFTVNAAPILGEASQRRGVLITLDDVSPLEAKNTELAKMLAELNETQRVIESKNEELETLATRDSLTGFLNRRSFMEYYSNEFRRARENDLELSVLMVDIDHFKAVNDTYGHLVGDQAIILVAQALGEFFRTHDYVGRYGGEEFVVAMPGAGYQPAVNAAERVRQFIEQLPNSDELPMDTLTVSIGIATLGPQVDSEIELIDMADRGLYKAKQTGRNQVCLFDPDYAGTPEQQKGVEDASSDRADRDKTAELQANLEHMKLQVKEQAKELTYRAMHDDLTRLPNRFLLVDRIGQAVRRSDRTGAAGAIISISLSAYQRLFDLQGHAAAEELMISCAQLVKGVIRAGDSVNTLDSTDHVTFSRIAHDELALLAVDLVDVAAVATIVDRVINTLEQPVTVQEREVFSLVHCGIALFPVDGEDPELLIRNATLARKSAQRRSGPRSGRAYFSKEIDALAIHHAHIASELHKAIADDRLEVVYQPKVDSHTHQVVGVEALSRWHHPELGQVSPQDFVSVAEQIGIVHLLTDSVVRKVCHDIRSGEVGDVRVSINISPLELGDKDAADRILNIVRELDVPTDLLEVEVTESSFLHDFELGQDILLTFKKAGVLISLDDFGTGFSSLNMLTHIPVDVIKIDRSFISNIHRTRTNHAIVKALLQMARSLGMRVVAEGVSNEEEYQCVKLLGCAEIQGFYFAKPMSARDFNRFAKQHGVRPRLSQTAERARLSLPAEQERLK